MNSFTKKLFLTLTFLSCSWQAFGYVWTFTNLTTVPIIIELRLLAWGYTYYDILNPGENSSRFEWPMGSWKAGFCIDKFLIGGISRQNMANLFGANRRPNASEIAYACTDPYYRSLLARLGKSEPKIKWISGEKWGTFDKTSRVAVNALTKSVSKIAEKGTNIALAAGAEAATGGTAAGAAGAAAYKVNVGKIFSVLNNIPGTIMDLAHKSPCAPRHFDIIWDNKEKRLIAVTKD